MKNKKYMFWIGHGMLILCSLFYIIDRINSLDTEINFCNLGLFCNNDYSNEDMFFITDISWIFFQNCSEYDINKEGIVINKHPYSKSFFKTLDKIINISEDNYHDIIKNISAEGSFEEIYSKYIDIFQDNYSLKIDECVHYDYIQNIEELISNNYHGDCDDYAVWLYLIAQEKELEVRYVIGFGNGVGHAWIQIKIDNEWIDYNSVINSIGKEKDYKNYSSKYYYEK